MAGIAQFEGDALFQAEGLIEFKAPGEIVDLGFRAFSSYFSPTVPGKRHGVAKHGQQQGLGGMGADDLAPKPGVDQLRHPADMVDMGMGEKQIVIASGATGNWSKGSSGSSPWARPQSTRMLRPASEPGSVSIK
jgi:hypothetical protein